MELAQTIKTLRNDADLTVLEAASKAGVSVSYWQKLEAGQMGNPSLTVLASIARAVNATIPDLLAAPTPV